MVLPAATRRRLGLTKGGALLVEETPDGVVLRTTEQAIARAQAFTQKLLEGRTDASVDDFLAERREWQE